MHLASRALLLSLLVCLLWADRGSSQTVGDIHTAADLRRFQERLQNVVKRVAPAVVKLRWKDENRVPGSGVVFDPSGLILTHGHHEQGRRANLDVVFPDGKVVPGKLLTVFDSFGSDWSLVKIDQPGNWPAASLHEGPPPAVNDYCFHLGYPGLPNNDESDTPVLRLGHVVAIGQRSIYAHCLVYMGDSGGPLFNLNGQVIGLANRAFSILSAETSANWVRVKTLGNRDVLLGAFDMNEPLKLRIIGKDKRKLDRNRGIPVAPFEKTLPAARAATVQVLVDGDAVCLGTVVRSDGLIVSKRSSLLSRFGEPAGELACRLSNGQVSPAHVVADLHEHDLVLLRVEQGGLAVVPWSEAALPQQGSLIAAVPFGDATPLVGVVSHNRAFRMEANKNVEIGFDIAAASDGLHVKEEEFDTGEGMKDRSYAFPRIKPGDLITHVNGIRTPDRESYERAVGVEKMISGDMISMAIVRNGRAEKVVFPTAEGLGRAFESYQVSRRRTGFPAVIGHDAAIFPEQCGGPVVDIEGRVIGINVARVQNYQTLAIPHTVARKLIDQMIAESNDRQDR